MKLTNIPWAQKTDIQRTVADLAWAAGIIDGEGSIGIYRNTTKSHARLTLQVSVGNTDPRMCLRLRDLFGGSVYAVHHRKGKSYLNWAVVGKRAADLCHLIEPYVICKRDQVEVGLAWEKTLKTRGHALSDEELETRQRLSDRLKTLHATALVGGRDFPL
jgi:hypothetical protein